MRVEISEKMNNYIDALSKEHSDFIQKWVDTLNTPELDEYISHLTEKEKDALFILLIIKSMNIGTVTNAEKTEEYIINQEENCNIICDIIRDITGIDIRKKNGRPQYEWVRKEDVMHSIAKQYSEHNEVVPIWLSIGDIKGGEDND